MAKRPRKDALEDVFKPTEPEGGGEKAEAAALPIRGLYRPVGISLSEGEREALQEIADRYNVSAHALMRFLLRWALRELLAGRIDLARYVEPPPEPPKAKIREPF